MVLSMVIAAVAGIGRPAISHRPRSMMPSTVVAGRRRPAVVPSSA
jgi:hypothetical protein